MQELQPQIAELLRTCIHPPSLRLRVLHVSVIDVNCVPVDESRSDTDPLLQSVDSAYRYATKLVLSDGQLMIQALLHRKLSTLGDVAGVSVGDLLEVKAFQVKKSAKLHDRGQTIYLAIQDCHLLKEGHVTDYTRTETNLHVKRKRSATESTENNTTVLTPGTGEEETFYSANESIQRSPKRLKRSTDSGPTDATKAQASNVKMLPDKASSKSPKRVSFTSPVSTDAGGSVARAPKATSTDTSISDQASKHALLVNSDNKTSTRKRRISNDHDDEDEGDFFESIHTNQNIINQRRQALRNLDLNVPSKDVSPDSKPDSQILEHSSAQPDLPPPPPPPQATLKEQSQVSDRITFQLPPPFHTLRSLRNPPANKPLPPKSYTLTTLGFIIWTGSSLIHRPGSPFPPKRHLKIIDPSLSTSRPPSREEASMQNNLTANDNKLPSFRSQNSFQDAITLAVYLDAPTFRPPSGTLALFRGVVMQRLVNGDIILNVYARLKDIRFNDGSIGNEAKRHTIDSTDGGGEHNQPNQTRDTHWYITDHNQIRALGFGSRLDYYLEWWRNKNV